MARSHSRSVGCHRLRCATLCYMASGVSVRELRQNLSKYLRLVAAGEVLEVRQRGRPVALLAPLPAQGTLLERLVSQGKAIPPRLRFVDLGPALPGVAGQSLSAALAKERAERS
jgi:prevent-host-death family protein